MCFWTGRGTLSPPLCTPVDLTLPNQIPDLGILINCVFDSKSSCVCVICTLFKILHIVFKQIKIS